MLYYRFVVVYRYIFVAIFRSNACFVILLHVEVNPMHCFYVFGVAFLLVLIAV